MIEQMTPLELLGTWLLDRRVVDRTSGTFGRMHGTLTLRECADGVQWLESGRFAFGGHDFDSSRTLLVRPDDAGWMVCFADGREFHPWRPGVAVVHPCRADTYRGLVHATPDRLRVLWDVSGPAKSQRILTRCVRAA